MLYTFCTYFTTVCVLWLQDQSGRSGGSSSSSSGGGHTLSKLFGISFGNKSSKPPPRVPKKVPSVPKVHGALPTPPIADGNESGSDDDDEDVSVSQLWPMEFYCSPPKMCLTIVCLHWLNQKNQ